MPRLRRARCAAPGYTRRRVESGWAYTETSGQPITEPAVVARIEALVIPPAWTDVWICPFANGHVQATGLDARDRRQYRYHDAWRVQRDGMKFDRVLDFAAALPPAREALGGSLSQRGLTRERVLACAVRLLDLGFFRIGSEQYAAENGTYGLATMRREHVMVSRSGLVTFDYTAKHGKHRVRSLTDAGAHDVLLALKRRRGGGPELLPTATLVAGSTSAARTSTPTAATCAAATTPPRTSAPGTPPCSPPSAWRSRPMSGPPPPPANGPA